MTKVTDVPRSFIPLSAATQLTADQLTELRFFAGESPDAIEWMLESCKRIQLRADETLLEPGSDNNQVFVVLTGKLTVRLTQNGDPISTLVQGDCAGEMSVLDSTYTSAWVIAHSDCELMVIDAEQVWSLITRSHIVAVNLLCILSDRVRSDNRLIDKSRQLKDFYEYHARVDALTGLNNRRWLDESIGRMTRRGAVNESPLSAIMLDLDHFKNYNDTHGHLSGDLALHAVASTIRRHLRPNDVAGRYGGEEFVVLLPDTDLDAAYEVADRLCKAIAATLIRQADGRPLPGVTVSGGVACAVPGDQAGTLLAAADAALYRAKHLGRNQICS
ncbi:MAG: GGDEF domain-containing protein [Pseudomonadota bacterium]